MELARGAPVGFLGLVCSYQQAMAIRHEDLAADALRRGTFHEGKGQELASASHPCPPPGHPKISTPPKSLRPPLKPSPPGLFN